MRLFGSVRGRVQYLNRHTNEYLAVTGSSRGLGKALLDAVLTSGQRAVATLRSPEVLADYMNKYPPSQLLVSHLDVLDNARVVEVFKEVKDHFGRLDVVVNNAGYGIEGELETVPEEEARKLFNVCFWAVVNISKQVCYQTCFRCAYHQSDFGLTGSGFHAGYQSTWTRWSDPEHEFRCRSQRQPRYWNLLCREIW